MTTRLAVLVCGACAAGPAPRPVGPYDPGIPTASDCRAGDVQLARAEGSDVAALWECSNGATVAMTLDTGWTAPTDDAWARQAFVRVWGENELRPSMKLHGFRDARGRRHAEWSGGFEPERWGLVHVAETRRGIVRVSIGGWGGAAPSPASMADLRRAFVEVPLLGADGPRWSARVPAPAPAPLPAERPVASPPRTPAPAGAEIVELAGAPGRPRIRATCPTMRAPVRARALVGRRYENAASALPDDLQLASESAVGASSSVVSATRGATLVILLARTRGANDNEVADALALEAPCRGLVLEARTCDVRGRHDPRVVALVAAAYQCGGHGESSPVRAWRVRGGRLIEIDATHVTCGSVTCEVDR